MGFTSGLIGGSTLTLSVLYLSLHMHTTNRARQHTLLRQQIQLLNSITLPLPAPPAQPRYEVRVPSTVEMLKDRWNSEVEGAARWVQSVRWGDVRDGLEERVRGMSGKVAQGVEGLKESKE